VEPAGREQIEEFLRVELKDGPVSIRHLQDRAIAAGLLEEGGRPLWKRKPWRRASELLGVLHGQQGREWFWRLPTAEIDQVPEQIDQAPTSAVDDLCQAPTVSDSSPAPAEDLIEARRRFAEQMKNWHKSADFRAAVEEGRREADEFLRLEFERHGLA
jgi:hypothetical protein